MLTATRRATVVPPTAPSVPRLLLADVRPHRAVLDGGWWPRSWNPEAELPGLILALSARYGPIRNVIANGGVWDVQFRRIMVGSDVVRVGWFTSLDAALLIATTDRGDQIDLLVVPPATTAAVAEKAMRTAADPANVVRGPDILPATPAPPLVAAGVDRDPNAVRGNEGEGLRDAA
jgi:hypothetical protein